MKMKLKILLKSSMLPGSGSGAGAMVDNDVVWDNIGLPIIPAKRIKGCLKDAAIEVLEMFLVNQGISTFDEFSKKDIDKLFGTPGNQEKSPFTLTNLFIENHQEAIQWINYLLATENSIISIGKIKQQFTELRTTTAIDKITGVAKKHSLRKSRYLKKGLIFIGNLDLNISGDKEAQAIYERILGLACTNFKTMGTRRNRGTGDIECTLWKDNDQLLPEELKTMEVGI